MARNFTLHRAPHCPNIEDHTACPDGYLEWHAWAEKMSRTHRQRKCPSCGLYEIWEPKAPLPARQTTDREDGK